MSNLRLSTGAPIQDVASAAFRPYGRLLQNIDFAEADHYLHQQAELPAEGNIYKASVSFLEALPLAQKLAQEPFGYLDIQLGYCNGHTHRLNALEWHKSSEVNYAATDMVLLVASFDSVRGDGLSSKAVQAFFVPRGAGVELLPGTLHFAPCAVSSEGFRCLVALPRGTNTAPQGSLPSNSPLLRAVNKWMLCHPARADLVAAGVVAGIRDENIELLFD